MRWIFLAPFVMLSSFCFGQVPDYVPQDGLISWHNLDGDAEASFGPYEGALSGTIPALNRHGEEAMALRFEDGDHVALGSYAELQGSCEFTVSTWFNADASNEGHNMLWCSGLNHWLLNFNSSDVIVIDTGNYCNQQYTSGNTIQNDEWHHVVTVLSDGLVTVWVNNEIYAILEVNTCMCSHPYTMMLATMDGFPHNFVGSLDEFGTWNRALDNWEIEMLYSEELPSLGCTEETACNYDPNAVLDDGSCEYGCLHCGLGTVWNDSLSLCLPSAEVCAEGTIWDVGLKQCVPINSCPEDLNYDGIIGVEDLLTLLSSFGTPCDPPVAEWTCGDPVSYHGYDYETVLIGEQCWFAENLRTELYQNGDSIENNLAEAEWEDAMIGAVAVYGEGESNCTSYTPDYEACDEEWSLSEYGRLYNGYTVQDARNLCPVGWHVPADWEWTDMTDFLGGSSTAADNLKATYGWLGGENGANSSGFNALPGGVRNVNGEFDSSGSWGNWWSSSLDGNGDSAWYRGIHCCYPYVQRNDTGFTNGISVRCLKD